MAHTRVSHSIGEKRHKTEKGNPVKDLEEEMIVITFWLGVLGTYVLCDGLSSLWAYHGKERWWRNQSFRVLRMIVGTGIVVLASLLMRS